MADLLTMTNIQKTYAGTKALRGVDFRLEKAKHHCLVGENGSGKSTLIKIISGVVQPDPGSRILFEGRDVGAFNPARALDAGIRVIFQDLALFPNLSVKENIGFQTFGESRNPGVNWKDLTRRAQQALDSIGLDLDLDRPVGQLSIAEQQLVEISRALVGDLKLLILDEPTASLTRKEVNALFAALERLRSRGVTTLFVSHKLNEIFEIAESVTVFRDGLKVGDYAPHDLDHQKVIFLMTGHQMAVNPPPPLAPGAAPLLEVKNLTKEGQFSDVSFEVKKGEILGLTGLLGAGRTELALSIFGMNRADSGQIFLEGQPIQVPSNTAARKQGIGLVPENRLTQGLVQAQSILDNLTLTVLEGFVGPNGLIREKRRQASAEDWVKSLGIKISSTDAAVKTLSGGNQQKIVLAKWLATEPRVLILDEPTIGIDVLAKNGVHELVKRLAREGMGIVLISDEIPEVDANCHRVLIMEKGRLVDQYIPGEPNEQEILARYNLS